MSRLAFGLRFTLSGGIWVVGSGSCGLGLHCVNYRKNGNKINSEVKDFRLGKKVCVFIESAEAVNFPFHLSFKISFRLDIKI